VVRDKPPLTLDSRWRWCPSRPLGVDLIIMELRGALAHLHTHPVVVDAGGNTVKVPCCHKDACAFNLVLALHRRRREVPALLDLNATPAPPFHRARGARRVPRVSVTGQS